ncbi:MAG: hypothetical protein FWG71_10300 [Synergistaceae bacterium]|nr:hypothetical protein [Synergistaceae bacterium]
MFNKLEISIWRAFFWPVANFTYWALIFLSWWDTRVKVFFGFSVMQKMFELRNLSGVRQFYGELEGEAYRAVAEHGSMSGDFIIIPLIMAVVMFIVPFIVRRDHRGPVSGYIVLPAMTLLCYFFASFLNLILVVALSAGIHYLLFKVPGPDIGMFMVHPLYIIYPIFRSIPGFASQCLYLAYIGTVLCTDSAVAAEGEDEEEGYDYGDDGEQAYAGAGEDDDWDRSACLMEMDRFSRILNAKFDNPMFVERLREDVASHVNTPGRVKEEVGEGSSHYRIILSETKDSLLSILAEKPNTFRGRDVLAFIVDEMARMEYISEADAAAMKTSLGLPRAIKKFDESAPPAEPLAAYPGRPPVRPPEVRWDTQRANDIQHLADSQEPPEHEEQPEYEEQLEYGEQLEPTELPEPPEHEEPEEHPPTPMMEYIIEQWQEQEEKRNERQERQPWELS